MRQTYYVAFAFPNVLRTNKIHESRTEVRSMCCHIVLDRLSVCPRQEVYLLSIQATSYTRQMSTEYADNLLTPVYTKLRKTKVWVISNLVFLFLIEFVPWRCVWFIVTAARVVVWDVCVAPCAVSEWVSFLACRGKCFFTYKYSGCCGSGDCSWIREQRHWPSTA
jgi:hypothetical protein